MEVNVYHMNAFTENGKGGNAAGIVVDAKDLPDETMLYIAQQIGYSETMFVEPSELADFRLRFFTPAEEVPLCGHGTIATYNLMRDIGRLDIGEYTQETLAGILPFRVEEDQVFMAQNLPVYGKDIPLQEILDCFDGMKIDELGDTPCEVVSTGLPDIIVPVDSLKILHGLRPNYKAMTELSEKYDVSGLHVFTHETLNGSTAHARNFAPRLGIDEESATGTANCALASYIAKYGKRDKIMVMEQGHCMGLPSRIEVRLEYDQANISSIWVGGSASEKKVVK